MNLQLSTSLRFVFAIGLLTSTAGALAGEPVGDGAWIDLTHDLSSKSVFWPTAKPFELVTDAEGMTKGGYYYSAYSFSGAEHGGTHIDAPVHFAKAGAHVDEIPLSRLIAPAIVVDVSEQCSAERDYLVSVADLERWETAHGPIEKGTIVLLRTGFDRHWPDAAQYLGTAERGEAAVAKLHFPGLHPDAARWLVGKEIASVGIDTASIDHGPSKGFESHIALMSAQIPAFENLTKLDALPVKGAFVVALPVKIKGGSGGPLRIVAHVPDAR